MIMPVVYIMGMWSVLADRKFIEMPCITKDIFWHCITKDMFWQKKMPGLYINVLFKLRLYDPMNNLMQTLKCYSCIGTGFVYAKITIIH